MSALCLAGPCLHALEPTQAQAQDHPVEVPESVVETLHPEGIRLGAFTALPRISFDLRHDSNVYNQPRGDSDTIAVVRPSLRLASDFGRHALRIDGAAESRRYFDNTGENSNQWAFQANGRLDLADRFTFAADVGAARRIERRGTFGDQFFTDRPVSYRELGAGAQLSRMGGIIEWQASISSRKLTYNDARSNGIVIDQSFRDVRRSSASLRIDYRRAARLSLFTRITGTRLDYDVGSNRDSRGFSILGGARYQVTDLVEVEGGVGYVEQDTRDPAMPDIKAVDYSLRASWTPDPRLKFELEGGRTVERSPLSLGSAILQSTIEGRASVGLGSKTLLALEAGLLRNKYEGADRRETRVYAEATVRRTVFSRLAAFIGVSARRQTGSGLGARSYDGVAVRMGIDFAF
ncbi:outer membrane beta-barrel protein [Novosphingobium sp. BL-52-GroH]|uniref:outer membrane beta-barrel protein n=1 Tax=Novosphingobium sp. BL-52-GroH TaxID=3349877 RepID=UPI003850DBD3